MGGYGVYSSDNNYLNTCELIGYVFCCEIKPIEIENVTINDLPENEYILIYIGKLLNILRPGSYGDKVVNSGLNLEPQIRPQGELK